MFWAIDGVFGSGRGRLWRAHGDGRLAKNGAESAFCPCSAGIVPFRSVWSLRSEVRGFALGSLSALHHVFTYPCHRCQIYLASPYNNSCLLISSQLCLHELAGPEASSRYSARVRGHRNIAFTQTHRLF